MLVDLIAITVFRQSPKTWELYKIHQDDDGFNTDSPTDELAEFAGRTCYLSYDRPRPQTATNQAYLANILAQGHHSVLEHSSASFYVEGVSRNLLIELERHRHISLSVVSTRYVDANKLRMVEPQAFGGAVREMTENESNRYNLALRALEDRGLSIKQRREAAAHYLPGGLETRFVVTGNFRAWRDVLAKRLSPLANAEIRLFAEKIRDILVHESPNSFQDMKGSE